VSFNWIRDDSRRGAVIVRSSSSTQPIKHHTALIPTMLARLHARIGSASRQPPQRVLRHAIRQQQKRTIIAAPKPGSGPLMERRPDRALPDISTGGYRWLRTLPIFAVIMIGSALAIFNYQKTSSSVVNSTLYALRTNPDAREILGDEIYFASQIPWISGELNQLHGRIDISFWVKGTKGKGLMRFKSVRKTRMGFVS
jgi:cytochrome c oxidase assembly factor 1